MKLARNIFFLGCLLALNTSPALCSPLDDLVQSPEMQKFDKDSKLIAAQTGSDAIWFKPGSNLEKIFATTNGAKDIVSWFDTSVTSWRKSKVSTRQRGEYLMTQVHYRNSVLNADVDVTILIPHPRYQEIVKMKLLKDFTDLEPPAFKPLSEEIVNIQGNPGHAYLKVRNQCSLVIKANHDAVINLQAENCTSTSSLVTFAKSLNISRLNRKLDS